MYLDILRALTREQHGLAGRWQLRRRGTPESTIDSWVESGRLEVLHTGIYRLAGVGRSWEQSMLAATMASGGLASRRSAVRLWGLADYDVIEVVVPRGRSARLQGVVVHHVSRPLKPSIRRGIPVTNPLDALTLLGGVVERSAVQVAFNEALIARLVTVKALAKAVERLQHPGVRGPSVMRTILEDWELGQRPPDSVLETKFPALLRRHRLPPAVFQHWVSLGRGRRARVDFAYPALKIAMEIEGSERHSNPDDREADAIRRNRLEALGWSVLVFTWLRILRDQLGVAEEIRDSLNYRA